MGEPNYIGPTHRSSKLPPSRPILILRSLSDVTLYTHSLLIHEEDTMVVSTSWRSSPFSCKPNTRLNWLNCWDLLLDIWEYTGTPPTGNWFFQWRRDPSKMSLTWYSWEKNALLQEVETIMVSSSWTSRECVYGLLMSITLPLSPGDIWCERVAKQVLCSGYSSPCSFLLLLDAISGRNRRSDNPQVRSLPICLHYRESFSFILIPKQSLEKGTLTTCTLGRIWHDGKLRLL